jgi:hypothetical protein
MDAAGRVDQIIEDPDPPAASGRLPGHPDVPAEVDQHAAAHGGGDPGRGPVGRQRLGGRAQVEHDRRGHSDGAPFGVQFHGLPAGRGRRCRGQAGGVPPGLREVTVVAELGQRLPAGRVHVAVGDPGGGQRRCQGLRQQRADPHRVAAGVVDPPQLGIRAEA